MVYEIDRQNMNLHSWHMRLTVPLLQNQGSLYQSQQIKQQTKQYNCLLTPAVQRATCKKQQQKLQFKNLAKKTINEADVRRCYLFATNDG